MWERSMWKRLDWWLLGIMALLQIFGLLTLTSATYTVGLTKILRQVVWMGLGILVFILTIRSDIQLWARWSGKIYWCNIVLLVLVLVIGHEQYGAQRWLKIGSISVQPSEFAKAVSIITLSTFLNEQRNRINDLLFLARTGLHVGIPFILVFLQPDLGTSLVLIAIWLGILFFAGIPVKFLVAVVLAGISLFAFGWHKGFIKDYQKQRLLAFIDPWSKANKEGYHIIQSQLAIGSGGLVGKGLFHGRMGKLGFVPAHHTDFIFTTVGEEGGFIGAVTVILLFLLLLWRLLTIIAETENSFGELIVAGVFCYFATHIVINIGMTLRLMPITGLPLPFFSVGGSNLVATYFLLGIIQGVAVRRKRLTFS